MFITEIIGATLVVLVVIYTLVSMFNPWTKPLEPRIEYWYYTYTYLDKWSDKHKLHSSTFTGSFDDLVRLTKAVDESCVILCAQSITKLQFEALK